ALAIPSWATEGDPVLEVLHATIEGLDPKGRIRQDGVLAAFPSDVAWCAPIRRSVIMEQYAYALSSAGFTVASLDDPTSPLASVPYLGIDPCWGEDGREDW
ncbi:MAG: hypothetical protein JXB39_04160, partial [Deltaproteobacteria bacterium]|nr:hypothetical protein [Deltaproteobacteria bacterium]